MVQQYRNAVREPKEAIRHAEEQISDARRRLNEYCLDGVRRLIQTAYKGHLHLGYYLEPGPTSGQIHYTYYLQEGRLEKLTSEGIGGIVIKTIKPEDMPFHELDEVSILDIGVSIEEALGYSFPK